MVWAVDMGMGLLGERWGTVSKVADPCLMEEDLLVLVWGQEWKVILEAQGPWPWEAQVIWGVEVGSQSELETGIALSVAT